MDPCFSGNCIFTRMGLLSWMCHTHVTSLCAFLHQPNPKERIRKGTEAGLVLNIWIWISSVNLSGFAKHFPKPCMCDTLVSILCVFLCHQPTLRRSFSSGCEELVRARTWDSAILSWASSLFTLLSHPHHTVRPCEEVSTLYPSFLCTPGSCTVTQFVFPTHTRTSPS